MEAYFSIILNRKGAETAPHREGTAKRLKEMMKQRPERGIDVIQSSFF